MENAKKSLAFPDSLRGAFTASVRLLVRPDGSLVEYNMEKNSGSLEFDAAVLRALLQPGVLVPPPDGVEQSVFLTFSVTRY